MAATSGSVRSTTRTRSEEHTSELQSPCNLVCRLLLEKKKNHDHHAFVAPRHRLTLAYHCQRRVVPLKLNTYSRDVMLSPIPSSRPPTRYHASVRANIV